MTGRELQIKLKETGLSQEKIASLLHIKPQNLSQFLKAQDIKTGFIEDLSKALGVDVSFFFGGKLINKTIDKGESVRYHDNIVTCGEIPTYNDIRKAVPDGYISVPQARGATDSFKVQGFSMLPTIKEGEIIGVRHIDSWEYFDPERIYLIITKDGDRMVKRILEYDKDGERLLLGSDNPNYKPFNLPLSLLCDIYRVMWHLNIELL